VSLQLKAWERETVAGEKEETRLVIDVQDTTKEEEGKKRQADFTEEETAERKVKE